MSPKAKRGTSSWHVQLRLLSKSFAVATILRTLAEQNYSACAFPMGLSALSASVWNTIGIVLTLLVIIFAKVITAQSFVQSSDFLVFSHNLRSFLRF